MPKRTKKLLVYLDQNFISEMAKADLNPKVKPEFKTLFQLLSKGFGEEKLVVPQSWFHDIETSLAPELKDRIVSYQNYLGQIDLHNPDHVRRFQIGRCLQRFLGQNVDPFETRIAFRDQPDQRVKMFNIHVDPHRECFYYQSQRVQATATLESIRQECVTNKVKYQTHLAKEYAAQRQDFLNSAIYHRHLCTDPSTELVAFAQSQEFITIPVISIYCRLWSALFTRFPTRPIATSDATDIDVLSTFLSYVDVVATDNFMAHQVRNLGIHHECKVELFTAKTTSLRSFIDYLQDYLEKTERVNRPIISAFVLPSRRVKEHGFKLFYDLGNSAMRLREPEYAEIYGFDDGRMPTYRLLQGNIEVPFYGLQDVYTINLPAGSKTEDILQLCRAQCNSEHFVVIHDYKELGNDFLQRALTALGAGANGIDGYRIFPTKA